MATAKLTKRTADALASPASGEEWLWDSDLGFGLKALPSGRKVFYLKYRVAGDRPTHKVNIGAYGVFTVDQARHEAQRLLGSVALGSDPARTKTEQKAALTVEQAFRAYLDENAIRWKPRTKVEYGPQVDQFIVPMLGRMKVASVSRADVARLLHRLGDRPILANRVRALMSAFFSSAVRTGLRQDDRNPCVHLPRHQEQGRVRFLANDELIRLGAAMRQVEKGSWKDETGMSRPPAPWQSLAAIRLLLFSGCRKTEILNLRWSEVDLGRQQLRLQGTKTGESFRPLSSAAMEVLQTLPSGDGHDRVIPGMRLGSPHDPRPTWRNICGIANLKGLRLHDLRHTVASRSQHAGHSLLVTGSLLGHRDLATTKKYVHLIQPPMQAALNEVTDEMAALMEGTVTPVRQLQTVRHRKRH